MSADVSEAVERLKTACGAWTTDGARSASAITLFRVADVLTVLAALQEESGALPASPSGGQLRPLGEWHEDYGDVLWWHPGEAPWVGTPLDLGRGYELGIADFSTVVHLGGWPGYHEWWTPLPDTPAMGMEAFAEGRNEPQPSPEPRDREEG